MNVLSREIGFADVSKTVSTYRNMFYVPLCVVLRGALSSKFSLKYTPTDNFTVRLINVKK